MKKSLVTLSIILGFTFVTSAQKAPSVVKEAFNLKFPGVSSIKWEMEEDSAWEAEFKKDGIEYSANFSSSGDWLETEYEIKKEEVSAAALKTISSEFGGYLITEIEMVEKPDFKGYEVLIVKGKQAKELVLDVNGQIMAHKSVEIEKD
ncbi:MAG: PepSY-like domain-containing protein [Bacteroidetes bacterium]|nr:PepSY-like domain-containing protein [Bacteroidota bacterium]